MDAIFNSLYDAMLGAAWLSIIASFSWGMLSILLSPCHLSGIPLIIGYITSQGVVSAKNTFKISLLFSIGILITIALIGIITASLGRMMGDLGIIGNYIVAIIFFVVGFYLLGLISLNWNFKILKQHNTTGFFTPLLLGLLFGLALGPCTFAFMAPVLGVVFETAKSNYLLSITLLAAFGIGHCFIIVSAGSMMNKVQQYLNWTEENNTVLWIKRFCGVLVILGGVYFIVSYT